MSVIDEYLQNVPEPQRLELERIRQIVHQLAPDAEEVISYGMPGFKYNKKYLVGFAPFKDHMSLFPAAHPVALLKDRLGDFVVSKGTIQFTLEKPIPEALIKELIQVRLDDIRRS